MITINYNGTVKETCYGNININNRDQVFTINLDKQTYVKQDDEWSEITDARVNGWRQIMLDNSIMIDYTTGVKAVQVDGVYPETSVGAYNYICGISLEQLGNPTDLAYVCMAAQIEAFVINNDLITIQ